MILENHVKTGCQIASDCDGWCETEEDQITCSCAKLRLITLDDVKQWLEDFRKEEYKTNVPAKLGEVLPSNAYRIRNEVIDRLLAQLALKDNSSITPEEKK